MSGSGFDPLSPLTGERFNMKSALLLLAIGLLPFYADGQNKKPKIVGQEALSTGEEQSITVQMTNLVVEDADDWFYPWGFTMFIYPGSEYTVSGHIVTPALNFTGVLKVQVSVHDGEDESNIFDLQITVNPVNDKPVITGHAALTTNEDQAIAIQPGHLTVNDPDNKYPDEFTLRVNPGSNYTVSGTTITPQAGFSGALSVNVIVNDGQVDSDSYSLPVDVKAVDRVPKITGQATLQVNEDETLGILLSHLIVDDQDSNYPEGFTLAISAGNNYTFSHTTIKPAADFFGSITVPVTVNDGKNTSQPFNLIIKVVPVNDIPRISDIETDPLFYGPQVPVAITGSLVVSEVDGDSIMFAEVGLRTPGYQMNADKFVYSKAVNSNISGVFDPNTGVLTLLGQASPASYTAALRSVSFQTIAPASESKVLYILVNDGKAPSETVERTLRFGQATVSLEIPTGFTPNGDQANDTWKIVPLKTTEAMSDVRIRVYNKQGIMVFESTGFQNEWDGRLNGELLPADTYFYSIDLNTNTPEGYLKGVVTILR
jgi:gliding motility-associated-like protein